MIDSQDSTFGSSKIGVVFVACLINTPEQECLLFGYGLSVEITCVVIGFIGIFSNP